MHDHLQAYVRWLNTENVSNSLEFQDPPSNINICHPEYTAPIPGYLTPPSTTPTKPLPFEYTISTMFTVPPPGYYNLSSSNGLRYEDTMSGKLAKARQKARFTPYLPNLESAHTKNSMTPKNLYGNQLADPASQSERFILGGSSSLGSEEQLSQREAERARQRRQQQERKKQERERRDSGGRRSGDDDQTHKICKYSQA